MSSAPLPTSEVLAAMVEAATDWPWHSRMGDDIWDFAVAGAGYVRAHMVGPEKDRQANAALIALTPALAAETIRLRADLAQSLAATQAMTAENARLLVQEAEARAVIEFVDGCFSAAETEGLTDRMIDADQQDVGSLHDLVLRRLLHAGERARAFLATPATETK